MSDIVVDLPSDAHAVVRSHIPLHASETGATALAGQVVDELLRGEIRVWLFRCRMVH